MACFVVPLVQAIATSVYRKKNEKSIASPDSSPFKHQLPALEKMLWGGSIMLIVDHIINGELTWRFPVLHRVGPGGRGSSDAEGDADGRSPYVIGAYRCLGPMGNNEIQKGVYSHSN